DSRRLVGGLEGVGQAVEDLGVGDDGLVGVGVLRRVDDLALGDGRDILQRVGLLDDLGGGDVLVGVAGVGAAVAVEDEDPVGVGGGDGLDGDVVTLVVVGGVVHIEGRGHADHLEDGTVGAADLGGDVADGAAGDVDGHDLLLRVVGGLGA